MTLPRELAFDVGEYRRRLAGVQCEMARRDLDLMLVTTLANVCYLTGIESIAPHKFWLVAVPGEGDPLLLSASFESHNARLSSWLENPFTYDGDPIDATAELIKSLDLERARIGSEFNALSSLSIQEYLKLKDALPHAEIVDATDCVTSVMAIKSEPEIAYLREAAAITSVAMRAAVEAVRDGATDNDVAAVAAEALFSNGSEFTSYPLVVTTGARSGIPHSTFKRNPIKPGDPVFIEIGACVHRYSAPMMRAAVLRQPSARVTEMAQACVESVNALLANIRAGAVAGDVAAKSEHCLAGLPGDLVWHGYYGYSVGLGFPPTWADKRDLIIRAGSDQILKAGMVFHCSTSLRDVGRCGATCSETVLVTDDGCEILTSFPRELILL